MSHQTQTKRPRGILRWFLRAPRWLFRFRLGWMMGERFLMLSHLGRKSGQLRQTVLEIVEAQAAPRRYIVASGWGRGADWFRNVQQNPRVLLDTAQGRFAAIASELSEEEAAAALFTYAQAHPIAFSQLSKSILGETVTASLQDCQRLASKIPLVAFEVVLQ